MRRLLIPVLTLSLAALVSGCGKSAVQPQETLPKPETRVQPRQKEEPRLIAPPPAYGNKVVMASVGQAGAVN